MQAAICRITGLLFLLSGVGLAQDRWGGDVPGQMPARFRNALAPVRTGGFQAVPRAAEAAQVSWETPAEFDPRFDAPRGAAPVVAPPVVAEEMSSGCSDACLEPCPDVGCWLDSCCNGPWWLRVEYLAWKTRAMHTPALVTQAPRGAGAALGETGTEVLFGGDNIFNDLRDGGRVRLGHWLDCCECWGVEGDFWGLIEENFGFCDHGGGEDRTIGRPFFDALNNRQRAELVAFLPAVGAPINNQTPDALAGGIEIDLHSRLLSAGVRLRRQFGRCDDGCRLFKVDLLGGYRFLRLDERLSIEEDLTSLDARSPNTAFVVFDQFGTETRFHGFELGLDWYTERNRWSFDVLTKFAFGNNRQLVEINGFTTETNTQTGAEQRNTGGLLAQTTNIGRFERSVFSVAPEIGVTLGYQVNDYLRATVGYNLLYWTNVARPGDQIDPRVNPNLLPPPVAGGPALPAFSFVDRGLWVQGFDLGFETRW